MLGKQEIIRGLRTLGIEKGDVLHVHSSMRNMGPVDGGFETLIKAFMEIIGTEGILSVPTHTWSIITDDQPVFHQLHTRSNVGAFPNYFKDHPESLRSIHPTHSVAAMGSRAAEFITGHESCTTPCSPDGPYGKLLDLGGKIVLLGVNLTRCTYFHCLEEIAGCGEIWSLQEKPVKRYTIAADGTERCIECRGHRDPKSDNYYRIEHKLLSENIMAQAFIGPCPVKVVLARESADWLIPRLKKDPKYFW